MKKSIFTKLTSLTVTAAIVMSFTSFIHADVTEDAGDPQEMISEDITVEEFAVPESDFDNDELAAKYIMNKMSGGSEATYRKYDLSGYLEQYDKTIFNYIVPVISDIASGNQTSAVITVPEDTLLISFSNTDLGVEDFSALSVDEAKALVSQNMPIHSSKIMNALLFASPYDLYWFDKTTGMGMTYSFSRSRTTLRLYNFTFYFYVANEYQGRNNLEVSSEYGEAVSAAASNANTIIENNAGLDDYSKLLSYNNEICKLTDYNYSAAGGGVAYGNPWQLVWVFDGDPDTKVVCEGYSKAFQYLCDNSVFRCSDLYTISVSGYLAGEGHMWNIVHMDDEKNYVVDITNSDPGGEGNYGSRLFLIGAVSGSVSSGYTLKNGYLYTYKPTTINSYSEDVITVSSADYNPNAEYTLTLEGEVGISSLSKYKAKAGEEISVFYTLPVGKELESILVNGNAIDGTTFTMPAMDTTVVVTFKKADYKITVSDTTGGTAYTDKTVANYEDVITVTATPDIGYKLDAIKVDGITIDGNTFEMPASDVTVEVTFVKIDYAVTVNCSTGGTASAPETANYGDEITVSVTPDTGYELDTIKVNDAAIGGNSFTMPASDVTIEVTFKKISYTISITNTSGGSANVDKTTAYYGEEIEIDIAIEEGYHLDSILVNGTAIDGEKFTMPAGNVSIEVIFVITDYEVTVNYTAGGTASAPETANYGDEITVSVTPDTGYELDVIKVNNVAIAGNSFTMPASDVTVEVIFKKADYKITLNAGEGGSVQVPSGANYGDDIEITVTPDTGYKLDAIKVDGITIDGNSFVMPASDVTVDVTFVKIDYAVTVSYSTGGTASAQDTANYGDEITVTVTPDTGYELDTIKVNDAVIDGNSFTMPASDVTVEVTFKKISYTVSITNTSGGSANVDKTTAYYGEEIEIDIAIEEGYHLDSILVNGTAIDGDKFTMPAGNVTIEVIFKKNEYTITVSDVTGGTASASAEKAGEGEEITVTVTPDKGYELDKIKVNNTVITGTKFTMPAANVTVEVTFKKVVYKISLNSSGNGTVNLSKTKANYGDEITVEITPASGYELSKITVKTADGSKVNVTDNTFVMPDANVTVSVTFAKISYGITVEDNGLGTVDVVSSAIKGNHIIVDISPAEGCELESLTAVDSEGNDIEVTDNSFTMPGASVTITAVFRKIDYTITIVCSDHGTATVSGNPANFGDEITVTALPDNGFELNTIKVDDEIIEGNTFTMPAKDITITVTFRDRTYSLNGWILEDGKYYFYENGKMVKGWIKSGSSWYYMDTETGVMVTGWKNAGGKWYYFTGSGAMVTGWQKIGGTWYFFESSGAMATGWKESGGKWYYFTGSGAMVTGWQKIGGTWYYFESSGAMATGWKNSGGKWYYFTSSGAMQTGWKQSGSDWYYLDTSSGAMVTGWKSISGKWYYFYDSGVMAYSTTIDGYTLGADGAMI